MMAVRRNLNRVSEGSPASDYSLVDLFSGCGGLTLGFLWNRLFRPGETSPILQESPRTAKSPFRSILANDFNDYALETYRANFDSESKHTAPGSIEELLSTGQLPTTADVVMGGPPCQGFSLLNKKREGDVRRELWWHFLEIAEQVSARVVVMENVPQLLGSREFQLIWSRLDDLGYNYRVAHVLCAANYGVPQVRNRAIILASRESPIVLPFPTHLSPRRKASLKGTEYAHLPSWRTVADAFKGLGRPVGVDVRQDASPADMLHFGRTPTDESRMRYKAVPPGGNRFDLQRNAPEITPACWVRKKSGGTDLFGRLWRDRPSVTIRTEFFKPEKGRYLHPTADRPITHREAARLQSFPDRFLFRGSKIEIARQIGNAVPPLLAYAIAQSVLGSLRGTTTEHDMLRMRDLFRLQLGERVDAIAVDTSGDRVAV